MRPYGQYCGLARALDHIGHRWTLLIVRELLLGPKRFTDLRHRLPGIATNLLSERLRALEGDALVVRRQLPPPAASTVYELTAAGRDLREAVDALIRWGGRWMTEGAGDDTFHPEWLALALDALGITQRMDEGSVLVLEVDGGEVGIAVTNGHLSIVARTAREPDLRVSADPGLLLGLAAGQLQVDDALPNIRLQPDTQDAARTFARIFSPAATNRRWEP